MDCADPIRDSIHVTIFVQCDCPDIDIMAHMHGLVAFCGSSVPHHPPSGSSGRWTSPNICTLLGDDGLT